MPHITDRDEDNKSRKLRLAKLRRGPGFFVYDGGATDHEWTPTVKLTGKKVAALDSSSGMPITDSSGRQLFKNANEPVVDISGTPMLGGVPKVKETPLELRELRGVKFPKGVPVEVVDAALALKLRGFPHFTEVEPVRIERAEPVKAEQEPAPSATDDEEKPKRGRPKKSED